MNKIQIATSCLVTILLVPGIVLAQNTDTNMLNKLESEIEPKDGSIGPVGNTGGIELMESVIKDYKEYLELEADSDDIDYLENVVERLEIAKAILLVSRNSSDIEEQYREKTIEELFDLLDATYESEDLDSSVDNSRPIKVNYVATSNQVNEVNTMSNSVSINVYKTHNGQQQQWDCKHKKVVSGSASSTLISYTNGKAKITGTFTYPAEINEKIVDRRNHQCVEFEHSKTIKRHDVLANIIPGSGQVKAQACTLTGTTPHDTDEVQCNAFGPSRVTLITIMNTYTSSTDQRTSQLGTIWVEPFGS